jgi:protein-disulfide isomerase
MTSIFRNSFVDKIKFYVQNVHMPEKLKFSESIQRFFVPVLIIIAIGLAFFSGTLWQKVKNIEKGTTTQGTDTQQAAVPSKPEVSLNTIKDLFDKDTIKFGDKSKKVLFVEVSDPSCPYCHIASGLNPTLNAQVGANFKMVKDGGTYLAPVPEIKKLVEAGSASFVWIYSPGHGNGEMGTKALYCANEKGKYWEAHDLLMTAKGYDLLNTTVKNDKTKSGDLAAFLKNAIDPTFLKECLDSGKYDARLTSDQQLAVSLGVQGTPGFYVNTTNFAGAYSYTDMKSVVDAALK